MIIITIANQKGGVIKTATTANLAHYDALAGQRVLAIDLDVQSNLAMSFNQPSGAGLYQ